MVGLVIFGDEQKCIQGFGGETWRTDHLQDLGTEGRIILKWISSRVEGSVLKSCGWERETWAHCCDPVIKIQVL
jgi:hypothetical protein